MLAETTSSRPATKKRPTLTWVHGTRHHQMQALNWFKAEHYCVGIAVKLGELNLSAPLPHGVAAELECLLANTSMLARDIEDGVYTADTAAAQQLPPVHC
jgi:hypothetical protein